MELKIQKAHAEFKNLNLRTENNGDQRVLACDVKLVADTTARSIAPLFEDCPDMLDTMFDEGGNVLATCFELKYRVPIENVELSIDKLKTLKDGKIKKGLIILPRNGKRVQITMQLQFSDVRGIDPFAKRLHEDVSVTIRERQQTLSVVGNGGDDTDGGDDDSESKAA